MVPNVGFELTTYRLQGGCSTPELIGLWQGMIGSNYRVSESKSDALPLGESPNTGSKGRDRTYDQLINSQLHYRCATLEFAGYFIQR